jgi:hypothetical protein
MTDKVPMFESETFPVIHIEGCIEIYDANDEARDWTAQEVEAFMCRFFAWLETEGVGFGGAFSDRQILKPRRRVP